MNETIKEWIEKANADYRSARRELNVKEERNDDLVCFLCEQYIEKLMKALPVKRGVLPPKIHDLIVLDSFIRKSYPLWQWNAVELRELTNAAVEFRYPGISATPQISERLLAFATAMRKDLLRLLED